MSSQRENVPSPKHHASILTAPARVPELHHTACQCSPAFPLACPRGDLTGCYKGSPENGNALLALCTLGGYGEGNCHDSPDLLPLCRPRFSDVPCSSCPTLALRPWGRFCRAQCGENPQTQSLGSGTLLICFIDQVMLPPV